MTNKIKHHGKKKRFSQYCLRCFSSSKIVECRIKNYLAINHTKSVSLPKEDTFNEKTHHL